MVAQLGARMHYAVPALLQRAGMLSHFFTDVYVGRGSSLQMLPELVSYLPEAWQPSELKRLLSRREDLLPPDKVTAFNLFGLSYSLALRRAADLKALEKVYLDYGRRFCELIIRKNFFQRVDGLYAFEGAALPLFQVAEESGAVNILEKFSAPKVIENQIISEEPRLWPGWEPPYPPEEDFQERVKMQQREWDTAQAILCSCDFVAQGLSSLGVPAEKLHIVPYGVDIARFAVTREPWQGQRPLHVLFVGKINLHKGVPYLYEALRKLNPAGFTGRMVGPITIREPYRQQLRGKAELTGRVPRQEVPRHYAWADVFVFPSLCESSATVTFEALAAGLPVITTPNVGSVVRDGEEGFIVPIRDADAIAAKLELLAGDPNLLAQMSENAEARAKEFSWEKYGDHLIAAINKIISCQVVR